MGRLIRWQVSPVVAGLILGITAVFIGTFTSLSQLNHYGFCTTCHGHDLVVGLAQQMRVVRFGPAIWPILTTVGVVLGAWGSSRFNGEMPRRPRKQPAQHSAMRFAQGFLVMSLALLAMGCPIRMTIRAADLNVQGFIGLIGVALGITLGVAWLKGRA